MATIAQCFLLMNIKEKQNERNKEKKHDIRTLGLPTWAIAAGIIEYLVTIWEMLLMAQIL